MEDETYTLEHELKNSTLIFENQRKRYPPIEESSCQIIED